MVETPCEMDFSIFPMDRVECTIVFESYSFNIGKVRLHWKRHGVPVEVIGETNLPDFHMTHYVHDKEKFHYPAGIWDQVNTLLMTQLILSLLAIINAFFKKKTKFKKLLNLTQ